MQNLKADPTSRNLTVSTGTIEEQELNNYGTTADRTVTIQTTEERYEEELIGDNSNNRHIQKRLNLIRYRIHRPPRTMRNIPKYHTTEKLQNRQVLKFDIRNPDPVRQLWN